MTQRNRSDAGSLPKADRDNRANQLNPNNDAFYRSQGLEGRDDPTPINRNEEDTSDRSR